MLEAQVCVDAVDLLQQWQLSTQLDMHDVGLPMICEVGGSSADLHRALVRPVRSGCPLVADCCSKPESSRHVIAALQNRRTG